MNNSKPFVWVLTGGHLNLIKHLVKKHKIKSALDVVCGNGEIAIMLSGLGVEVISLGTDPGIIERAKHRAVEAGQTPTFLLGDMRDVCSYYPKRCGLITCMGNSLSHLLSNDDIWGTLAQFYTLLMPGGILVIHTLNYDLIYEEQEKSFPLSGLMGTGLTVNVNIESKPGPGNTKLIFNVSTVQKGIEILNRYEFPIRPIYRRELNMLLAELGFKEIKNYGFDARKIESVCWHNVTLAYRPVRPGK